RSRVAELGDDLRQPRPHGPADIMPVQIPGHRAHGHARLRRDGRNRRLLRHRGTIILEAWSLGGVEASGVPTNEFQTLEAVEVSVERPDQSLRLRSQHADEEIAEGKE